MPSTIAARLRQDTWYVCNVAIQEAKQMEEPMDAYTFRADRGDGWLMFDETDQDEPEAK
jgi:hypothetical protein